MPGARIAIHTLGTRGDVQPYIALARGLLDRGHAVQLAAPAQFAPMIAAHGIDAVSLPAEFLALLDTPEGKRAVAGGTGFLAGFKLLRHVRPLMRQVFDALADAADTFTPDLVVHHPKSLASPSIAERRGIPHVLASPLPGFTPTRAFPTPLLPFRTLGPLNRASHALMVHAGATLFSGELRTWRRERLDLRGRAPAAAGTLYAYSPSIVPVPPDWGEDVLVSGAWFLDEEGWTPPAALTAFLDAGPPPIYVGFGSMPGLDPRAFATSFVEALGRTGHRGILALGGGALVVDEVPSSIYVLDGAPHAWLFPRLAATIHHGGAGTTAASLRAGTPTVICPFFGDQPFWARRVAALGVGPPPLDRRSLTVDDLVAAIRAATSPEMTGRARALGAAIRTEDGVGRAVTFLEQRLRS